MSLGERIARRRTELGITQLGLANTLDVSRQAVSKWEKDQSAPDTLKLIQLADALSTDVEYLATGKHTESKIVTVEKVVENVVETVIEKPVYIEKRIPVEKIVERTVEKPVVRKVYRTRYLRSPLEFFAVGLGCFLVGLLIGKIL